MTINPYDWIMALFNFFKDVANWVSDNLLFSLSVVFSVLVLIWLLKLLP